MTVIRADVAVVGAGSAGCIAAIAAARAGLRTVLVDRLGAPGGTSTAVLDTFYAFFTAGAPARKVVQGLPDEPVARLRDRGVLRERPNSFGSGTGYTYDPETLKLVWAELLAEAGVTPLHTTGGRGCAGTMRVRALTVATRAGWSVEARHFVDASGDADLVARAGGGCSRHRRRQPATTTFRMASVDIGVSGEGRPHFRALVERAADRHCTLRAAAAVFTHPAPGVADGCDAGTVARSRRSARAVASSSGLEQVDEWARFLRQRVPGFESAVLVAIGAMAGVRETRRIHGRHVLTEAEVLAGACSQTRSPSAGHRSRTSRATRQPLGARRRNRRLWGSLADARPGESPLGGGRRPVPLRYARRPRLRTIDGHVHGDGRGGRRAAAVLAAERGIDIGRGCALRSVRERRRSGAVDHAA